MDAIVERQIGWNGIAPVPELSISITVISRLPSYRLTSEPGSPVPERVGVLSLVIRIARDVTGAAANISVNQRYDWHCRRDAIDNDFPTGGGAGCY